MNIRSWLEKISIEKFKDGDNQIRYLNYLLFGLILFIGLWVMGYIYLMEKHTTKMDIAQRKIQTIVMMPTNFQVGGIYNQTNKQLISTNITKIPVKKNVNTNAYFKPTEYAQGDVVIIQYFNIAGIVTERSLFNNNFYKVLYRDNNHTLQTVDVPISFLLRPTKDTMNPFMLTQ